MTTTETTQTPTNRYDWVGKIQTASGIAFDVINPKMADVSLADIAQSISHICRYNGHVPTFYSVAEHCVRVAKWLLDQGHGDEMALTGLLHDAPEAYVGDMVRPLKRYPALGDIHQEIEGRVAEVVHAALGGTYPHPEPIHQADYAIYEWEVANIRSGVLSGWGPEFARQQYVEVYHTLSKRLMAG